MSLKLKSVFKIVAPIVMVAMSSNAHAVKWVGEAGLHAGGDKLDDVTLISGNSVTTTTITGGGLFSLGIGPQIDITSNTNIRALFQYKSDSVSGQNGSIGFTRFPIDVMYFHQTEQWNFGGGLTYHLNPKLSGSGVKSGTNADYDNAFGFVAEVDYRLGEFFYLGGKYTSISYKPQESGAKTISGNSIGVVIGAVFGD